MLACVLFEKSRINKPKSRAADRPIYVLRYLRSYGETGTPMRWMQTSVLQDRKRAILTRIANCERCCIGVAFDAERGFEESQELRRMDIISLRWDERRGEKKKIAELRDPGIVRNRNCKFLCRIFILLIDIFAVLELTWFWLESVNDGAFYIIYKTTESRLADVVTRMFLLGHLVKQCQYCNYSYTFKSFKCSIHSIIRTYKL